MNAASDSRAHEDMRPLPLFNATQALSNMPHMEIAKTLRDIALEWLIRIQQAPQDQALRAALADWLDAAPEHANAYEQAQRIWQLTGQLAPTTSEQWPLGTANQVAALKPRRRWPRWIALAAAVCVLIGTAPTLKVSLQSDYRTGLNEQQRVELDDGSVVLLDSDTAISINMQAARREVQLLKGQAFFEIATDVNRPFHVLAGDLDVRVTGTAFSVELGPQGNKVAVDHGSVEVTDTHHQKLVSTGVGAGQSLSLDNDRVIMAEVTINQISPWRNRQLVADNQRIADVVLALQRYVPGKIVINDAQLAEQRITGLYSLDQPALALQAMLQPHGGNVATYTKYLWVISR